MGILDGFEVLDAVVGMPTMSITKNGITFNKTVIEKLACPEHVQALIDKDGRRLAIAPCNKDAKGSRPFFKEGRDTANGVRWNNYDLKKTLETMMGWNLEIQGWKSTGTYLEDEKALLFDLNAVEPQRRG